MIGKIATESVDRQPLRFDCGVVWDPHAIGERFGPGRHLWSSILLFYILRPVVCSDCMGISVEVEDYMWICRIVEKENLARLVIRLCWDFRGG